MHYETIIIALLAIISPFVSANVSNNSSAKDELHLSKTDVKQQQREQQLTRIMKVMDDDGDDDDNHGINKDDDVFEEAGAGGSNDSSSSSNDSINQSQIDDVSYDCKPDSQCELCHGGKRGGHSGCSLTGRRIKMKCLKTSSQTEEPEERTAYSSCRRTSMEEEFLVVQFQALCAFIAFFSLRSVRKEKTISASLFDLRARRRIKQEMVPLTKASISSNESNLNNNNGTNEVEKSDIV